jgi:hypothetical protein
LNGQPKLHEMERTEEEKKDTHLGCIAEADKYPWGLSITLTEAEIEKLDLDENPDVGDIVHLFALAKVISVSKEDKEDGSRIRVGLQITHLGLENEDDEDEDEDDKDE